MKKLNLIGILWLCFGVMNSQAQRFAEEFWHTGKVILEDGNTVSGNLKFSLENEIVQVEGSGPIQTLTSRKVLSFQFYDRFEQKDRYYYTLPFSKTDGSNYKTPAFFELLAQGETITLLGRETMVVQTTNNNVGNPFFNPTFPITTRFIKTNFYFLYKNGKIKPYDGTKKTLMLLLQDRERDIKEYLKNNKVKFDNKDDIANLIRYYNTKKGQK